VVSSAGANVFVAGSAIFYSEDYEKTIRLMRERMRSADEKRK
jgi:pentose-5-phosphate-3-epimerase